MFKVFSLDVTVGDCAGIRIDSDVTVTPLKQQESLE
jgi:hypothetical protein